MADAYRILVVEENETLNQSIVNALRNDNYLVQSAQTVPGAQYALSLHEFDAVIAELKAPRGESFELLQWMRSHHPNSRMIMIAAFSSHAARLQALEAGVASYLEKPLDLRLLKEELRRLLRQSGFTANLESFDLLDVIQIINLSRRNIALVVQTGLGEKGVLCFQKGELIWAEFGALRGDEAFFALAAYKHGTVSHQQWNERIASNVTLPLSRLIFQALQYRSKYADDQFQPTTGHANANDPTTMHDQDMDSPFLSLADEPFLTAPIALTAENGRQAPAAKEWWQKSGEMAAPGNNELDERPFSSAPRTPKHGADPAFIPPPAMTSGASLLTNMPKSPVPPRTDLPSWLTEQPTDSTMQKLPGSATAPSKPVPATPLLPLPVDQWDSVDIQSPALERAQNDAPQARGTRVTAPLPGTNATSQQRTARRNYPALISALQTLGYAIPGFIATAIVTLDGQPIAEVAIDELDISQVFTSLSAMLQGALLSLRQGKWGDYEQTILTSRQQHILLRLIGNRAEAFHALITTREADPATCLQLMSNVEATIAAALR